MRHPIFEQSLSALPIAVFDLETTGLYVRSDRIIQIAAVLVESGKINGEGWVQLVHPGDSHLPLDNRIVELTKITDADLVGMPDIGHVIKVFDEIVGNRVIAGHRIKSFDIPFIRMAQASANITVQTTYYIDTWKVMKRLHKGLKGYSLSDCADYYNLPYDTDALHDAKVDTQLCANILLAQIEDLKKREVITFEDMLAFVS